MMAPEHVQWESWDGSGLQHVAIEARPGSVRYSGLVIETIPRPLAVRFDLVTGEDHIVRSLTVERLGVDGRIALEHDGQGTWYAGGERLAQLDGVLEPDISVTPLTNTFPIRRLALAEGASADIRTAYVDVAAMTVFADPQRYTCLTPGRLYRYESRDSDFSADIALGDDGVVDIYPGLFRRRMADRQLDRL
jgi:hypothetical protein